MLDTLYISTFNHHLSSYHPSIHLVSPCQHATNKLFSRKSIYYIQSPPTCVKLIKKTFFFASLTSFKAGRSHYVWIKTSPLYCTCFGSWLWMCCSVPEACVRWSRHPPLVCVCSGRLHWQASWRAGVSCLLGTRSELWTQGRRCWPSASCRAGREPHQAGRLGLHPEEFQRRFLERRT